MEKKDNILNWCYFILVLFTIIFSSCNDQESEKPFFFREQKFTLSKGGNCSIFYINTDSVIKFNDSIGYFFKSLIFYRDFYEAEGFVYLKNNNIFLRLPNASCDFKIFNFNLKKGDCESVKFDISLKKGISAIDIINKRFELCLEDKFYDKYVSDTIYQFRLKDFGVYVNDDDVVLFLGQNVGIQGYILGDKYSKNSKVISIYYNFRGNIYANRPYFKNLVKKKLL